MQRKADGNAEETDFGGYLGVSTEREIRIQRLMESRGYSREKAESIMARQASDAFFRQHADHVIENNGDLEKTYRQIEEGIRKL